MTERVTFIANRTLTSYRQPLNDGLSSDFNKFHELFSRKTRVSEKGRSESMNHLGE